MFWPKTVKNVNLLDKFSYILFLSEKKVYTGYRLQVLIAQLGRRAVIIALSVPVLLYALGNPPFLLCFFFLPYISSLAIEESR